MPAWAELPVEHRRWLLVNAVLITAVLNVAVNAAIAWLFVAGQDDVTLWGRPLLDGTTTVVDALGTLFVLPLVTCLIVTTVVRSEIAGGGLTRLGAEPPLSPWLERVPRTRLRRGARFGLVTLAALAIPVTLLLLALAPDPMSRGSFVAYKVGFTVALGAVVTPVIALRAMRDEPGE
jgi:hypothetical protein